MERRGFLGSIIGTILINKLDFFARSESEPWQHVLLPYRMLYRHTEGIIQAPGIKAIEPIKSGLGFRFQAEDLHVKKELTVVGSIILTESGKVITENKFSEHIHMIPGDCLKVTHSLTHDLAVLSLEEVVDLAIQRKKK